MDKESRMRTEMSSQGERRDAGELSVLSAKERPDCVSKEKWSKVLNTGKRSSRRQLKNGFLMA